MLMLIVSMFIENAHVRIAFLSFLLFFFLSVCRSMHTYPILYPSTYIHTYVTTSYPCSLHQRNVLYALSQIAKRCRRDVVRAYHIKFRVANACRTRRVLSIIDNGKVIYLPVLTSVRLLHHTSRNGQIMGGVCFVA